MPKKAQKEPSKDFLKEVGERIAATMREKKVTQAEMGDYLGISQAAVSAWNSGSDPGCEKIIKIAEKLGVSVGYLLIGEATTTRAGLIPHEETTLLQMSERNNERLIKVIESQQETIGRLSASIENLSERISKKSAGVRRNVGNAVVHSHR